MFARFSTVAGERGAADAERDIRGFAVKFYTEEGNWDMVGNNTPVFFLRDPLKFPDLNHAVETRSAHQLRNAQHATGTSGPCCPEALHQITIAHRATAAFPAPTATCTASAATPSASSMPRTNGSGSSSTSRRRQGIENLTDAEAEAIIGKDRESHQRDLYEAIEQGDFPRWDFKVQIMPEKDAASYRFHPFDLTKVWPHADYPLIDVGVLELNRNPENYHAEVEQSAFNPANIVPGIGFSPDKMLQGRLFSYGDTQRYRLGVNHAQIPVNKPRCPVASFHRDGLMRVDGNYGSTKAYEPNSLGLWQECPEAKEPPLELQGAAYNWDAREDDDDYYTQPGMLFRIMSPEQQQAVVRKHRGRDGGRRRRGEEAPHPQLPEGRSGLWRRRGQGTRHLAKRRLNAGNCQPISGSAVVICTAEPAHAIREVSHSESSS